MVRLEHTTSSAIAAELVQARLRAGSPAMGMVLTLVVVTDEAGTEDAMAVAREASHEHPARVLGVVLGDGRGAGVVDAEIGVGDGWTGETALIRLRGEVVEHPESVVLPLLLPDSPVAVWWSDRAPADPATDPIGQLGQRRITDAAVTAGGPGSDAALAARCAAYQRGDTDFAWTRLTPWRALLAAALDQHHVRVTGARVAAEHHNPSAALLATWLADRLKVPVAQDDSDGPGVTEVVLQTRAGDVRVSRGDGTLATYSTPGRPDRAIALKRRTRPDLLAEELRRLSEDEAYAATVRSLVRRRDDGSTTAPTARQARPATRRKKATP